jgi:uncharacterized protein (DUF488 family)
VSRSIWTIGHSNRSLDDFVELLHRHAIEAVADVRRYPGSRRYPYFSKASLAASLPAAGIDYVHFESLGGRRTATDAGAPTTAWRVAAFNAYADFMRTPEFAAALDRLETLAAERGTAVMCAEALPWRCHRRLVSDALIARGWTVLEILSPAAAKPHELPSFAEIVAGTVVYRATGS